MARKTHLAVSETRSVAVKLDAVRVAARHEFPVDEIAPMLAEIESGYKVVEAPKAGD